MNIRIPRIGRSGLTGKSRSSAAEPGIIGKLMIESFGASDQGCVRGNNEDSYLIAPALGLYIVADGMGGAQAGEHASRLAVETVREVLEKAPPAKPTRDAPANAVPPQARTLLSAFEEANRRVMSAAAKDPAMEGMGTTMVAALEAGNDLLIASVGDSRAYVFDQSDLRPVTEDQTWVNEVGRKIGLDEETLKVHPMRHVLTMAIGVSPELRIHSYLLKPVAGSQVLLCSDGLHGVIQEDEIAGILSSKESPEDKCRTLIASAREHGGPDNITAILLQVS
jgi:serine/threonine protein phosphatase PrpC